MAQTDIPPQVDSTWRDDLQAAGDAAEILRIPQSGPEFDRLKLKAITAGEHICQYLDRTEPIPGHGIGVPPPALRTAQAQVTVELYRRKDAPFGVLGGWNQDDGGQTYISPDPLAGVKPLIMPYKARFGLA